MSDSCRSCWGNCALRPDSEILEIDKLEDEITPLAPNVLGIRQLISTLELCHHKAERWVANIIEAIGSGETNKGLGTRSPGGFHPAEQVWQDACSVLWAWCAGCPAGSLEGTVDTVPASEMVACLGPRSPLKEWQVQRVIERIRTLIHWPQLDDDPAAQYEWVLFGEGEDGSPYHSHCPERFKEHEDFWLATVRTIVHDTHDGHEAELSLGLAIDMLWPCHWRFVENLQIVLEAIGGSLHPARPFAACARNIGLLPNRARMETISNTLRVFCGHSQPDREVDAQVLALLGEPTQPKRWLAASLDKTIRLQLNAPDELRALSSLAGPGWIRLE